MPLIEHDLFGAKTDKVQRAIDRIRAFCPEEGYFVAFSGGKDSVVVKALCDMAGIKYDAHYSVTTVDPPELVRFIISQFDTVVYDMSDTLNRGHDRYYTTHHGGKLLYPIKENEVSGRVIYFDIPAIPMRELIVKKKLPPTRHMRYCCEYLKETYGEGRVTLTGVRWSESRNRKNNQGVATIFNGKAGATAAESFGADFSTTGRDGVILNLDNDAARRTVEHCYRTNKTLVNPIIDWTNDDVWEFIRQYSTPYCLLYDDGCERLGCIGCPLGGYASQKWEFNRWPIYKKLYIHAFDDMLTERRAAGRRTQWETGEDVFRWWIGDSSRGKQLDGQIKMMLEEQTNE